MAMTVKVAYPSGEATEGIRVCVWIGGVANEEYLTDGNGEVHFDYGPGTGTIYCNGYSVGGERSLMSYERVICRPSGLHYLFSLG